MNLFSSQIRPLVRAAVAAVAFAVVAVPTAAADDWYRDPPQPVSGQPVGLDPAIATAIRAHKAASSRSSGRAQPNPGCKLRGVDPAIVAAIRAHGHCLRTQGR